METLEILSWQEVIGSIENFNPELANIIYRLDPPSNFKFIRARYYYGDEVLTKGVLNLRSKGKLMPFTSREIPSEYVKELSYAMTPLGMSLNKNLELFITDRENIVPYIVYESGCLFGLWSILSDKDRLNSLYRKSITMTAGNKSMYILPKVTDTRSFNRLKREFGHHLVKPETPSLQANLFKSINDVVQTQHLWFADVIFFSRDWFDDQYKVGMQELWLYLFKKGWDISRFLRETVAFKFSMSNILTVTNLKPNPYITDIVNHLYAIRRGFYPGFGVANEDAGPVNTLEKAFVDIYKITAKPIFMNAKHFHLNSDNFEQSLYYFFNLPTLMDFSPKSRVASKVVDILELQHMLDKLMSYVLSLEPGNSFEAIENWLMEVKHVFYHSHMVKGINYSGDLIKDDPEIQAYSKKYPDLGFCASSSFLRGCVRIQKNC